MYLCMQLIDFLSLEKDYVIDGNGIILWGRIDKLNWGDKLFIFIVLFGVVGQ